MANKVRCIQLGNIAVGKSWDNPQSGRIYSVDGIAPTLNTCGGGAIWNQRYQKSRKGKKILQTGIKRLGNILPTSTRENPNQGRVYDTGGIAPAITSGGGGTVPCIITETEAKTWLKESLLQAEGETQAIHQTEPQAYQRNNGQSQTQRGCAIHLLPSKKTTMFWR